MRTLMLVVLMLLGVASAQDNLDVTFRTRYQRNDEHGDLVEGHGTAFAVDLTAWSLLGRHYLLTAAHNTYDDQAKERENLQLELTSNKWVKFDVVWVDRDMDIAVIRCAKELPRVVPLATDDAQPKERVTMLGSPQGIPIKAYQGVVLKRFADSFKTKVLIQFDHGDSGGPLFNQDSQIVGMAVSGFLKKDEYELDPKYGGFIPISVLRSFLDEHK
jgi:S1-C subfamily serine protease